MLLRWLPHQPQVERSVTGAQLWAGVAPPGLSSPRGCCPQPTGPGLHAEASRLLTQPPGLVADGAAGSPRGAGCLFCDGRAGFLVSFGPAVDSAMAAPGASGGSGGAPKCLAQALAVHACGGGWLPQFLQHVNALPLTLTDTDVLRPSDLHGGRWLALLSPRLPRLETTSTYLASWPLPVSHMAQPAPPALPCPVLCSRFCPPVSPPPRNHPTSRPSHPGH